MRLRALTEDDKPILASWTASDSDHRYLAPDWIYRVEKAERWMIEDKEPRLAFRVQRALRVDIQFNEDDTVKTAKALISGFDWLLERAQKAGFTEVIFESKSQPLIRFCEKRFGFRKSGNELVRAL